MYELDGKTVLVTGASKGIGSATVRALGAAGANVVAHYSSDKSGAEQATAAVPPERKCLLQADFADLGEVESLWDTATNRVGKIDVLVNNAATMLWDGGFEQPLEQWDLVWERTLAINLLAPARLLRRAVNAFLNQGGGTIITISSWAAQKGVTNPASVAYGASKAAVHNATQTIARAYASHNILAYLIAPGVVHTKMSEDFAATQGGEQAVTSGLAMGEWVPPDEIAALATYLATGRVRHLSGATLDVNGASYIR